MKPFSTPPTAHDKPLPGFSHSRAQFEALVDSALAHAKRLGASDAAAQASEGCGLSVSVRKGELENVERNRDKSLGVTVYVDHRRGNASTSDFSDAAIAQTRRLRQNRLRRRPAAARDAAAPPMEQRHPHVVLARHSRDRVLRLEERPVRRHITTIFITIRITEHHMLVRRLHSTRQRK